MIGEINPTASNGHRFILAAIDYFTKWVEAASFAFVTKNVVDQLIKYNLICRYGISERIIMENDYHRHSRTCHKFLIYADKIYGPPVPLNVLTAPWLFAMWGIYMIGEIKTIASNGNCFILVTIDYFTKCVEATSFSSVTKNVMARFIKHNLICQYGILERIITNNGTNLNNTMITNSACISRLNTIILLHIGQR